VRNVIGDRKRKTDAQPTMESLGHGN
jgi:hypothetical protein